MRVLYINSMRDFFSGAQKQLDWEIQAAKQLKIDWKIIVIHDGIIRNYQYEVNPPKLFRNLFLRNLYTWFYIIKVQKDYDIIINRHITFDPYILIFGWFIKNRYTVHHAKEVEALKVVRTNWTGNFASLVERFTGYVSLKQTKGAICVTTEIANYENKRAGIKTFLYPNGIDLNQVYVLEDFRLKDEINIAFMCGVFAPWHGLDLLLVDYEKNINFIKQKRIIIHLIGKISSRDFEFINNLDSKKNIILHGSLSNIEYVKVLSKCDVGLDSLALNREGLTEGSALKTREYLAYGLPVYSAYNDTAIPYKFKYYKVGKIDIEEIYKFVMLMKNTTRTEVRKESVEYISKEVLLSELYKQIEESYYLKKTNTFSSNINKIEFTNSNKILFISYYFPPLKAIGSLRTYYFAKFLNLKEWNVSVLTTSAHKVLDTDTFLKPLENITKIDIKTFDLQMIKTIMDKRKVNVQGKINLIETKKSLSKKILFKFRNSLPLNILYEGGLFYIIIGIYKGNKIIKTTNIKNIYSTFSPFSNHIIAYFIKLLNKNCYWVADFRDLPFGDNSIDMFFYKFQIYINKIIIRKADKVTTISEGLKNVLKKYNNNIEVLTNGYDDTQINIKENVKENVKENISNEYFDIVYTGMLYSGERDASVLFKVIKQLIFEDEKYKKIRLVYAGKDSALWSSWAKKYELENYILIKGVISREEAIKLQLSASINLLLTWSSKTQTGILTGKLFEYLSASKPIICIINGIKDKEIENMFCKINCGIVAYENSEQLIKKNISSLFDNMVNEYNYNELVKYSYSYLSEQLVSIYSEK